MNYLDGLTETNRNDFFHTIFNIFSSVRTLLSVFIGCNFTEIFLKQQREEFIDENSYEYIREEVDRLLSLDKSYTMDHYNQPLPTYRAELHNDPDGND